MPMSVFMDAVVDNDVSQIDNFDDVFAEYNESIGGRELELELDRLKREIYLRAKVTLAECLMFSVQVFDDTELFEYLKSLQIHMRLPSVDLENPENYCKQIEGWLKNDISDLLIMETQHQQKQQSGTTEFKYTRDYFEEMFIELESVLHVHIDATSTVRRYCKAIVALKRYRETLLKQQRENQIKRPQ